MIKELSSYVIAIAEKGNVSKAAESLFISQPSLSRYIKDLENRLGVQLFQRINNRLILTHAGEKYVETAKRLRKCTDLGRWHQRRAVRPPAGGCAVLRMSYNMPFDPQVLYHQIPQRGLTALRELYHQGAGIHAVKRRDRPGSSSTSGSSPPEHPLFEEELLIAVPAAQTPGRQGRSQRGLQIPGSTSACSTTSPTSGSTASSPSPSKPGNFQPIPRHPSYGIKVKSVESAFRLAEAGLGCAIVPETVVRIPSVPVPPKIFSFGDPITKWNLAIAYREDGILQYRGGVY